MLAWLPFVKGLRGYKAPWAGSDVTAGLAIAAVAIPSAIAYPAIAGLPPEVGVYSSILPLVGYALFGPSRQLIVGPDAATMTVLAAVLATTMANTPQDRVAVASALALTVGVFCIVGSRLNLGILAAFLSRPLLVGFISGISVSIMEGQFGRFTGLKIEADGLVAPLIELAQKSASIHWPSVILGVSMLAVLMLLRRSPVPGPLVVVVMAVIASALFDFEAKGIDVVGDLPQKLPAMSFPFSSAISAWDIVTGAAAVWLVSLGSGLVAARSFAARGKFEVDANAELNGLGAANIASGLFSGFPVTVSDSRTATNMSVGGRTQIAALVAALALTLSLFYLNDALRILPEPALGAILVAAAISLIDIASLREIWHISKMEFAFALIGMWGAISLGVLRGVVLAVAATLLYVLLKEMRPRDAMLGRIPGQHGFYKLHRSPNARPVSGLAVCLIQGSVLFFNVDYVKGRLKAMLAGLPADTRWFVLDASAVVQVDSTAAAMLEEIRQTCAEQGVAFGLAELHIEPMQILKRAGLLEKIGPAMTFEDLEDVARAFRKRGEAPNTQVDDHG